MHRWNSNATVPNWRLIAHKLNMMIFARAMMSSSSLSAFRWMMAPLDDFVCFFPFSIWRIVVVASTQKSMFYTSFSFRSRLPLGIHKNPMNKKCTAPNQICMWVKYLDKTFFAQIWIMFTWTCWLRKTGAYVKSTTKSTIEAARKTVAYFRKFGEAKTQNNSNQRCFTALLFMCCS